MRADSFSNLHTDAHATRSLRIRFPNILVPVCILIACVYLTSALDASRFYVPEPIDGLHRHRGSHGGGTTRAVLFPTSGMGGTYIPWAHTYICTHVWVFYVYMYIRVYTNTRRHMCIIFVSIGQLCSTDAPVISKEGGYCANDQSFICEKVCTHINVHIYLCKSKCRICSKLNIPNPVHSSPSVFLVYRPLSMRAQYLYEGLVPSHLSERFVRKTLRGQFQSQRCEWQ